MKNAEKIAKIIRILTVPPLMALALLVLLWFERPGFFASGINFFAAIVCLTVLPAAAYPFSLLVCRGKGDFRMFQRRLAIIFTLVGYAALLIFAFGFESTVYEKELYVVYAGSSVLIAISSISEKTKASGHACSISGPIYAAAYYLDPLYLLCYFFMPIVFWASVTLKRHTLLQLIVGTVIPIIIYIVLSVTGIFY